MNKLLYIALTAAGLSMASCNSDEPTLPATSENDFESADGQLVIQLGADNVPQAAITRATQGPIEGTDISQLDDIGIFAVARNQTLGASDLNNWYQDSYSPRNILLGNAKATGTTNDAFDVNVHPGLHRISFFQMTNGASDTYSGTTGAVYYYPMKVDRNYDFFGYFPRVATNRITVTNNNVQIPFTITGNMDIIAGRSETPADINENTLYVDENGTNGDNKTISGYNAKYIREIKYHNWLIDNYPTQCLGPKIKYVPNIVFNHLLTKLNFQVITAKEQAGGPGNSVNGPENDREEAKNLRVKNISVTNTKTNATLNLLGSTPTITFSGTAQSLPMIKNSDATTIWADADNIIPQEYQDGTTYKSAGYLMLQPGEANTLESYTIQLTVVAPGTGGIPTEQTVNLEVKPSTGLFRAGHSYNIRIALYAMQKVHLSASLTGWTDDEDIYAPVE